MGAHYWYLSLYIQASPISLTPCATYHNISHGDPKENQLYAPLRGTTWPIRACLSCSPCHSGGKTRALAARRGRRDAQQRGSIAVYRASCVRAYATGRQYIGEKLTTAISLSFSTPHPR